MDDLHKYHCTFLPIFCTECLYDFLLHKILSTRHSPNHSIYIQLKYLMVGDIKQNAPWELSDTDSIILLHCTWTLMCITFLFHIRISLASTSKHLFHYFFSVINSWTSTTWLRTVSYIPFFPFTINLNLIFFFH